MSYTSQDVDNALAYSDQRLALKFLNLMHQKFPHLVSHLQYEIRQADPENDYYYPESFQPWAIVFDTKLPPNLCEKISCNNTKQNTVCVRNEMASYYRVGDDANFERHCEPACYNLLDEAIYNDETGEEAVQMIRLNYYKDKCIIMPPALLWQEFPFYRSQEVYELRMNDLPLGFNRDTDLDYTYSGRSYKYNELYCSAFYDKWSEEKQTCVITWYERILYAVIGESIIKLVKGGIDAIKSGPPSGYVLPDDLPPIPPIESIWTLEGWSGDINTEFILPPTNYTLPPPTKNTTKIYRETHTNVNVPLEKNAYKQRLKLLKTLRRKEHSITSTLRKKLEAHYSLRILSNEEKQQIYTVSQYNKKFPKKGVEGLTYENIKLKRKMQKTNSVEDEEEEEEPTDSVGFFESLGDILGALVASMATPGFWIDVGIGELSEAALKQFKKVALKLADTIIPKLTNMLLRTTTKMLSKVFAKSLFGTIAQCATKILIKTLSKVMIQLTKLMAEIASVVGIILAILTVFDIILTIWDPFNFNSKFDPTIIASVTQQSDEALRMSLEVAVPEMTFDLFSNIVLSPDDILDICVTSFGDIYQYLDSLTVNSEGSRIVKGFELDIEDFINPDGAVNDGIVESKKITPYDLYLFEKDHALRMRFFRSSKRFIFISFSIASVLLLLELYLFSVLVFIFALTIVMLSYLNTTNINVGRYMEDFYKLRKLKQ